MSKEEFTLIDNINNWSIYYVKNYNEWLIEHEDGYYIFCESKKECYETAKIYNRTIPNYEVVL